MIEHPDFYRKRRIPATIILAVALMIVFGIWVNDCTQRQLAREITFSNITLNEYSPVHVEVGFTLTNASRFDRDVNIILTVSDTADSLLADALFQVHAKAHSTAGHIKIIDKLRRPLQKNEKPGRIGIAVFPRKVL